MKKWILIATLFFSPLAFAHEGHDEPVAVQAPKGGVIKGTEEVYVEVVSKGKDLKIYTYTHDLKPLPTANIKIKAKAELPRNKKTEDLILTAKENLFETSYDAKGSHRYTLILLVSKKGHEDKLTFTVEPKK